MIYLALAVLLLTSVLGALSPWSAIVFIYTPLKRVTLAQHGHRRDSSGRCRRLMGWTAARNELSGQGWALLCHPPRSGGNCRIFCDCMDLSRAICPKPGLLIGRRPTWICRTDRQTGQQTGQQRAGAAHREPVPLPIQDGRDGVPGRRGAFGHRVSLCAIQFSRQLTLSARGGYFWLRFFICRCCSR